ncbi:uncharacterized protein [Diadema antillarum]|uniref:uncharacterized protein n=1 Tax=Diadema antillarum TaxID=105358 RepID=UPI003A8C55D2
MAGVPAEQIPSSLLYQLKDVHSVDDLMKMVDVHPNEGEVFFVSESVDRRIPPKTVPITSRQSSEESGEDEDIPIPDLITRTPPQSILKEDQIGLPRHVSPLSSTDLSAVAELPTCIPRPQVVELPVGTAVDASGSAVYWPPCVTVNRCGGCCSTELLQCAPNSSRQVDVQVLSLMSNPDATQLQFAGVVNLQVHEDVSCECQCRTKPSDCHPTREVYRNCQCECVVEYECPAGMVWDPLRCDCVCNVPLNERTCRRRQHFDEDLCGCKCLDKHHERCLPPSTLDPHTCVYRRDEGVGSSGLNPKMFSEDKQWYRSTERLELRNRMLFSINRTFLFAVSRISAEET